MWNAIYRKFWMITILPLLAGGIAYFTTGHKAGKYRSVAVIEASIPDGTEQKTLKDIDEPDEYYENLVETMKTEVITSMASYRLLLHDIEQDVAFRPPAIQYSPQKRSLIKGRLQKKLSSFELLRDTDATEGAISQVIINTNYNVARWLRDKQMTVVRRPASNEIEVTCSTEDPFLSAFAANALSQEYIRYQEAITAPPPTNDSVGYYREEVNRLRKDLDQKTSELTEASKSKVNVNEANFRRSKADRIAESEMRILEEESELDLLRTELAKIERPEPEVQAPKEPINVAANAKIQSIKNKIDQLSRMYIEGGSKDRQLDSTISRLRRQLTSETVRLQSASKNDVAREPNSATIRDRQMLLSRIRRHEDNIQSLRNNIRRVKNSQPSSNVDKKEVDRLEREMDTVNKAYSVALASLKKAEVKAGPKAGQSRESHHLILKEKALPSAEPESPWAMTIVISAFIGTLLIVLIYIAITRPAPPPYNDIFLRVNYANQRRMVKKKHPREGDVSLSNN